MSPLANLKLQITEARSVALFCDISKMLYTPSSPLQAAERVGQRLRNTVYHKLDATRAPSALPSSVTS